LALGAGVLASNRHDQIVQSCQSSIGHQLRHSGGRPLHGETDDARSGIGGCSKVVTQLFQTPGMRAGVEGATAVPERLQGFRLASHPDREPTSENPF